MNDQAPETWHDPQPGRAYADPYAGKPESRLVPLTDAWAMGTRGFRRGLIIGALVSGAVCIAVLA